MNKPDYAALSEFCRTPWQQEVFQDLLKTSSQRATAKNLGRSRSAITDVIQSVSSYAESRGELGELKKKGQVPEGFYAETSVKRRLNPESGVMEVVEDWTKSRIDKERQHEAYLKFIEGLTSYINPIAPTKFPSKKTLNPDLTSAIIFGDAHLGMLAHAIETDTEDYNLSQGISDILAGLEYCLHCAPDSKEGWFINVGDWTHTNDTSNATPGGKNSLDVSARHNQTLRAAGNLIRQCIDRMLKKFETVTVINARGNHDRDAAFGLNLLLEAVYENEPRVKVKGNDSRFHYIEFGKCLIGVNHGDRIKPQALADHMTRMMSEAWGRTTFRRWWIGHIHHKQRLELNTGLILESFHTLAPVDYWHSAEGYGAERRVTMITLHKEYGEINNMSPPLELVRAFSENKQVITYEQ